MAKGTRPLVLKKMVLCSKAGRMVRTTPTFSVIRPLTEFHSLLSQCAQFPADEHARALEEQWIDDLNGDASPDPTCAFTL